MKAEAHALRPSDKDLDDREANQETKACTNAAQSLSRSQRNVHEWNTYLPKDCVDSMIAMGWDEST
jgi:hypothetical protein